MTRSVIADATGPTDRNRHDDWEHWWTALDGTPGEIVWDADASDLYADLNDVAPSFDERLPVVDVGCGDGRQTRFLARHFPTMLGVDFSEAAIARARACENPANASYRLLDARDSDAAPRLHAELGDANIYVRGVLQALPPTARPNAVDSIARLLGGLGTLFAKELPPEASGYFAAVVERYGVSPGLARVMRLIPPARFLPRIWQRCSDTAVRGGEHGKEPHPTNKLPDGEVINVPAIYVVVRPRR